MQNNRINNQKSKKYESKSKNTIKKFEYVSKYVFRERGVIVCFSSICFCRLESIWRSCSFGVSGFRCGCKDPLWWRRRRLRIFSFSNVDVGYVGVMTCRLDNFNSLTLPFRRGRGNGCSLGDVLSWWSHVRSARLFWGRVRFWKWERY